MSDAQDGGRFSAGCLYGEDALNDFEALYRQKSETPLSTRVVLGALGGAGAAFFGWKLYAEGAQITYIGYLLICSVLLVLAFSRRKGRADDTPGKYRKHYLNRHVSFRIDDEGVEMRLEGQKNYARSKFKDIHALNDTDRCLYFIIRGNAYYILPKEAVAGGDTEALMKYMEKKSGKKFQHYDVSGGQ